MTTRKNLRNVRKSRKNTRKSGGGLNGSKPTLYTRNMANTRKVSNPTISNTKNINYFTLKNAVLKKNTTPFAYKGYSSHPGKNPSTFRPLYGENIERLRFNQKVLKHINSNKVTNKKNFVKLLKNMDYDGPMPNNRGNMPLPLKVEKISLGKISNNGRNMPLPLKVEKMSLRPISNNEDIYL